MLGECDEGDSLIGYAGKDPETIILKHSEEFAAIDLATLRSMTWMARIGPSAPCAPPPGLAEEVDEPACRCGQKI